MKINVIRAHDDVLSADLHVDNIKGVLAGLKFQFGEELTDRLLHDQYKYVLMREDDPESAIALAPEVLMSSFAEYDRLIIVRDLHGETGVEIGAFVAGAVGLAKGTAAFAIVAAAVNIAVAVGVSLAISAIMQAISPTPEFSSDPSEAQKKTSALFNGAPVIREQGGIVPWILGAPYCGGVLISSGVSSEDF